MAGPLAIAAEGVIVEVSKRRVTRFVWQAWHIVAIWRV